MRKSARPALLEIPVCAATLRTFQRVAAVLAVHNLAEQGRSSVCCYGAGVGLAWTKFVRKFGDAASPDNAVRYRRTRGALIPSAGDSLLAAPLVEYDLRSD